MTRTKYILALLVTSSLSLQAAVLLPEGKSVEVKPLTYNYTVVQNFETSIAESSHTISGSLKENEKFTNNARASGFGYFGYNHSASSNATHSRNNTYNNYKEGQTYTASSHNDTIIVEKIMYSDKMTSVIETAFNEAGVSLSRSGDYILTGSIKAMRTNKPRIVPDGSNTRYAASSTTSIHIQVANKKTGKIILAKTFTGMGQQTFNMNDPIPAEETVDMSIEDLTSQITAALTGKITSKEVDYQDSPGKRLID